MNVKSITSPLHTMLVVLLGFSASLHAASTDVIQKSFEAGEGATLQIEVERTDVSVTTWDQPSVEIVLTRNVRAASPAAELERLAADSITVTQKDEKILVHLETADNASDFALDYTLVARVPASISADITASAGPVYVRGLQSETKIRSAAGQVSLRDLQGEADVNASGAGITSRDTQGEFSLRTSGAGIRADNHQGHLETHASGGSILVLDLNGSIKARTTGGGIEASFASAPTRASELYATGAPLQVTLPATAPVTIEATATAGKIHSDFPLEESGSVIRTTMSGKINNGGKQLSLRATGANITINSK